MLEEKSTKGAIDKKAWGVVINFGKKSALEKPRKFELSWSR